MLLERRRRFLMTADRKRAAREKFLLGGGNGLARGAVFRHATGDLVIGAHGQKAP